jgi:hypothetical protein
MKTITGALKGANESHCRGFKGNTLQGLKREQMKAIAEALKGSK